MDVESKLSALLVILLFIIYLSMYGIPLVDFGGHDVEEDDDISDDDYGHGLIDSDYQLGDNVYDSDIDGESLPNSVSYRDSDSFPSIGNQGTQDSCVGWAVGYYANTFAQAMNDNSYDDVNESDEYIMSPSWVYNKINGGVDGGTYYTYALDLLRTVGNSNIDYMDYNENDYKSWGNEEAWINSHENRISSVENTPMDNIDVMRSWLDNESLPMIAVDMDMYGIDSIDGQTINSYDVSGDEFHPNHANVIVGYDDDFENDGDVGAFRVVNSWGDTWSCGGNYYSNGDFWITYDAIESMEYSIPIPYAYSITEVEYEDEEEPSLRFDLDFSKTGSRDVDFGIDFGDMGIDYEWVDDEHNDLPSFMSFDATDLEDDWYYNQDLYQFEFELTDGSSGVSEIDSIEMVYNVEDEFVKTIDSEVGEDNRYGLVHEDYFITYVDVIDSDYKLDVGSGEFEVIFEYSMDVGDRPYVNVTQGNVSVNFDRWGTENFDNDKAIFTYENVSELEDVEVDIYDYRSILYEDNGYWYGEDENIILSGDVSEPTVDNVGYIDEVGTGEDLYLEFEFDDYTGLDEYYIEYWFDDGEVNTIYTSEFRLGVPNDVRSLYYRGVATDVHGTVTEGDVYEVDVTDTILPRVVEDMSDDGVAGDYYNFEVEVDDNIGIDRVYVTYSYVYESHVSSRNTIEMDEYEDDVYRTTIELADITDISYNFNIFSESGNYNESGGNIVEVADTDYIEYYERISDNIMFDYDDDVEGSIVSYDVYTFDRFIGGEGRVINLEYDDGLDSGSFVMNLESDDIGVFGDYYIVLEFEDYRSAIDLDNYDFIEDLGDGIRFNFDEVELYGMTIYENHSFLDILSEWISSLRFDMFVKYKYIYW